MEVVVLCGGLGTRLSEETQVKPKPMVEIGGKPILWHIMKLYEKHGHNSFVLALGYKGEIIKDYFMNYHARSSNIISHLKTGRIEYSNPTTEDWKVSMIDTGQESQTGGRLLRLKSTLKSQGTFMLTYGDGLCNVDLTKLIDFHKSHGRIATVTAVRPSARFGDLNISENIVKHFEEKPQAGEGWINGGFFIFEPAIFDYIENDLTILEKSPLEKLAENGELMAFKHHGYWQSMDTLREKESLQALWESGDVPWLK
tara:strand:- start:466 stop:1233 length:768 start_codon:yes stop_codon:yes gene_type:complete